MIGILLLLLQAAIAPLPENLAFDGDPVDLGTGLYVNESTDLFVDDSVFPVALIRTYRTVDTRSRAFGVGASHPYEILLVGDSSRFSWIDLILPDGGRFHYTRTSPGTGWVDAVLTHTSTPTRFYQSTLRWNRQWGGWEAMLEDGTMYQFPASAHAVRPSQAAVIGVRDKDGNSLKLARNADGELTQILCPGGRRLDFTYDAGHRITEARDDRGRSVRYRYDGFGRLVLVTEPTGRTTRYTYDPSHRMLTVEYDGRLFLTNEYDLAGRAVRQVLSNGGEFVFTYKTAGDGKIIQTDVRSPSGRRRRVLFNSDGYIVRDTNNLGASDEETIVYEREPGTNRELQRRTIRGRGVA